MLPTICLEWPSTVGQFLHTAPLNNINKSPKTLKTNIPVRMNMCKTCRLWRRRKIWNHLKWLNFFLCILVSLTLIVSSNMSRFLVGNTWWKWSRRKNVNYFISSVFFCCISAATYSSLPLLCATQSHLLSFSPSSSHNQTSQITFSEMKSKSLCLMCPTVPVYSTW